MTKIFIVVYGEEKTWQKPPCLSSSEASQLQCGDMQSEQHEPQS